MSNKVRERDIAVIGIGLNYPYSKNIHSFWKNIASGKNFVADFPKSRIKDLLPFFDDAFRHLAFGKNIDLEIAKGAFLEEIDKFDNQFFKISPLEAKLMDPCQRLFLQVAYSAIEDAGYGGDNLKQSRTGVFVGFMPDFRPFNYKDLALKFDNIPIDSLIPPNLISVIPSRISYFLDLKGPTMTIDTSCSASLVSVHQACQSIITGECDMAIAGGIKLNLAPLANIPRPIIESLTGYSRAFDNSADGIGIGEGAGAVFLKPLKKAIHDNDNIHAIIKGSAINQDGRSMGIACPNYEAQVDVIINAWKNAEIVPESVTYIEAHGTGTKVGDPIEVKALDQAFNQYTNRKQFCAISSVKTNLGHLYEGAGIVGLIKTILCLKNRKLPATLHFEEANENIDFINSALYVTSELEDWETKNNQLRICGVNAFGISGTNCHIVLEEYRNNDNTSLDLLPQEYELFTISAYKETILKENLIKMRDFLKENSSISIQDLCYTTNIGRGHYSCRLAIICNTISELQEKIHDILNNWPKIDSENIFYNDKVLYQSHSNIIPTTDNINSNYSYLELKDIARAYARGLQINWNTIYKDKGRKRISLPVYSFEKKRFWFDFSNEYLEQIYLRNPFHYNLIWKKKKLEEEICAKPKSILMIVNNHNKTQDLVKDLKNNGHKITTLLEPTSSDLEGFFNYSVIDNIDYIIHAGTLFTNPSTNLEELITAQEKGMFNLHCLLSVITSKEQDNPIKIVLLTDYSHLVDNTEDFTKPEYASLIGFGKIIPKEFARLNCKAIDIDYSTSNDIIIHEIFSKTKTFFTAYRKNTRFIQEFCPVQFINVPQKKISIKKEGVYIITGGTGGIGLTIADYLAQKNQVNIALISRLGKVRGLEKEIILDNIRKLGASVDCYAADIGNFKSMKTIIDSLRKKYGRINGIFHCAGVAGSSFAGQQSLEVFKEVSSVKIEGTFILDQLTIQDDVDLFVLFSSVATIFPAVGQGDYCAANSFLDSYATIQNQKGRNFYAINWVAWRDVGMAKDLNTNVNTTFKAISNYDALSGLTKVIEYNVSNALIGELNSKDKIILSLTGYGLELSDDIMAKIEHYQQRNQDNEDDGDLVLEEVKLIGRENDIYSEIERNLSKIWGATLEYTEINIFENIYDLGGDSLTAATIAAVCESVYGYKINIHDILKHGNIDKLSEFISKKLS